MITKFQYYNQTDRQSILDANSDKTLIEEQNITDGNFLIFNDELFGSLPDVKTAKIARINNSYYQRLKYGFQSSATGKSYTFRYGTEDVLKFLQLDALVDKNKVTFPVKIPAKDGTLVPHTLDQYNQLVDDITIFAKEQNDKQHDYINQVNTPNITIAQVNAITITF